MAPLCAALSWWTDLDAVSHELAEAELQAAESHVFGIPALHTTFCKINGHEHGEQMSPYQKDHVDESLQVRALSEAILLAKSRWFMMRSGVRHGCLIGWEGPFLLLHRAENLHGVSVKTWIGEQQSCATVTLH